MTLLNFDTDLDVQGVAKIVSTVTVTQEVKVVHQPSASKTHLLKEEWDWAALRDYVVSEIEARFGSFPRYSEKEYGIFNAFLQRHGADKAQRIARAAFEVHDGRWAGAPISINRFCKASDVYFAEPIAERLSSEPVTGWS